MARAKGSRPAPTDRDGVAVGNAIEDGTADRGWFVGSFVPTKDGHDPRSTAGLEVKWGIHARGETRTGTSDGFGVYSLAVLISGRFAIDFPEIDRQVELTKEGDYVLYGPDEPHGWRALEDSTVITVRWPARPPAPG